MIPHIIASMFDISWFFRGLEKFNITATYSSAFLILEFILIILFVRRKTDLLYYIIILSVIKLLTSISLWKHLKKYIVKIELKEISIKKHFRQTLIYFIPTIHSTSHFAGINHTYSNSYHYWFMDRQSAFLGILSGKNMVTAFLLCITYSCQGSRTSGST